MLRRRNVQDKTDHDVLTGGGGVGGGLSIGCLMSQQHSTVSQGWTCSDNRTCCRTAREAADQTSYLT